MQSDAITRGLGHDSSAIVRLAWVSWWVTLLFEMGFIGLAAANWGNDPYQRDTVSGWELVVTLAVVVVVFQSMATIGVLIVRRDPSNAVGWLFCAVAAVDDGRQLFHHLCGVRAQYQPGNVSRRGVGRAAGVGMGLGMTLFAMSCFCCFPTVIC